MKQQNETKQIVIILEGKHELFGLSGHLQEIYSLCGKYHTRVVSCTTNMEPKRNVIDIIKNLVLLKHSRQGCINVGELVDMLESLRDES